MFSHKPRLNKMIQYVLSELAKFNPDKQNNSQNANQTIKKIRLIIINC
jgi:hypothetical protein